MFKFVFLVLGFSLTVFPSLLVEASDELQTGKIVAINNNNSLKVLTEDGETISLRLCGIDSFRPRSEEAILGKEKLIELVGTTEEITYRAFGKSRFQQTIAEVWLDEVNLNQTLFSSGVVRPCYKYPCF